MYLYGLPPEPKPSPSTYKTEVSGDHTGGRAKVRCFWVTIDRYRRSGN